VGVDSGVAVTFGAGVGVGGSGVKVAVGNGVTAGAGVGVSLTTASTVASISGNDSVSPPQLTNSITAEVRRSSRMPLSFMPLYYPKSLLNGSATVILPLITGE
jgi:F0F1-type ATP synthase membrane subunit c/vacuolar-type H+-ATPase subunit K